MFLQKEDSGIVVETIDEGDWENLKQEAEQKGMTCRLLSIENFILITGVIVISI